MNEQKKWYITVGKERVEVSKEIYHAYWHYTEKEKYFIAQNFRDELTIAQIAQSAAISESECLRCFRNNLRTTPSRYLREFRLQRAEELLVSTNGKTGDVGAACGFSDAAYFTKLFREAKGCTPLEYRRAHGGEM